MDGFRVGGRGAEGGGGGEGIYWGGDTSGYYTKPQETTQSPKILHKAPEDYTKLQKDHTQPQKDYTKPRNTRQSFTKTIQRHQILNRNPTMLDKYLKIFNKSSNT